MGNADRDPAIDKLFGEQGRGVYIPGVERSDDIGEMARAVVVFRDNVIDLAINQRALANEASLLAEKLAAEQRLTQLQRNFGSMASHEFRTPLTTIDGHAQRLINAKDRLGPDDVVERAQKIRGAVLRITSVIENLIDSSRLIEGDAELYFHPAEIDLGAVKPPATQWRVSAACVEKSILGRTRQQSPKARGLLGMT